MSPMSERNHKPVERAPHIDVVQDACVVPDRLPLTPQPQMRGLDVERRSGFLGWTILALGCLTLGFVPLLLRFGQRHFARRLDEFGIEARSGRRIAWNEFTSIKRAQSSLRTAVGGRVVPRCTFSDDLYSPPAPGIQSDEYLLESPKGRVSVPLQFWWVANGEALREFTLTHLPPHLLSDVKRSSVLRA